jgi:hypothetical protein
LYIFYFYSWIFNILYLAYLSPFVFLSLFFFCTLFFGKKISFFIFYTWNIYHSTLDLFIPFFLFLSLFFCNFFLIFSLHYFFFNYYTKTKEIVFHYSNCNIVLLSCYLKIYLRSYIFLLKYMIFTIVYYM